MDQASLRFLGKYREIVLAVGFFLVFDLAVLVLNFYTSYQIAGDAVSINLSGRQRMLSQRMTKSLLALEADALHGRPTEAAHAELKNAVDLFDGTLAGFRSGGTAVGGDKKPVPLNAVNTDRGRAILDSAYAIWTPYLKILQPVAASPSGTPERLSVAVQYAREHNLKLLGLMNDLTTDLEQAASAKADRLRLVQTAGIILALLNFAFILFKFIRRLQENDHQIEQAQQKTQEVLRDAQAIATRFKDLVETTSDWLWEVDIDNKYTYVSPKIREILGYSPDEVLGRSRLDLLTPGEAERVCALLATCMASRQPYCGIETSARHKTGQLVEIETAGVPVLGPSGVLLGYRGMDRDITQRKRAETALLESETRHSTVLAAVGEGVYGVDWNGRCTFINRAALDILGFAEADLLGQDQHAIFHHQRADGRSYPRAECPIHKTVLDGELRREEEWFIRRDGTGFPVEMVATPIVESDGRRGAVVAFRDISARRRAEEDLRKLSRAVEQSPDSIVITDLEARIEYVNEAFLRNTGYGRDEVIGTNPRVLHSGNTPAATYQDLWATLADGLPWKGEFFNRRKDGSEYVEFAVVAPIRQPGGRISHYVAVKEDITERKRIAAELSQHRHHLEKLVSERTAQLGQARERAESANRAKSAFLATMSHELRTPMNGVLGMIDLLHQSELNPDQRDMMGTVSESAHSLLRIIDDILDFSKIEAGKLNLDMVPVSIAQVVEGVAETLAPIALKKNVELLLFCDPGIPQWVRADPVRLRQVLFNLAGNAVKFTGTEDGKAGKVVIRADLVESAGKRILVRMRVIDNGIGMSEDSVEKLFQPFMQAENSTTRRFGGTGLGLSISMRLAHLMGGAIEVHSTPGVGSSFSVAFDFEGAQGTPAAVSQFDLAKLAVVVFAPGEDVREILVRYLEHSGAQVLAAQQPDDAVKHASAAIRMGTPWVVVVADVGRDTALAAALRNRFSDAPELAGTRFVMIERGRRHTARLQGPDCVSLDANAMGRRALQQAVAVAAGRASPEPREDQAKRLLPASRLPSIDEAEAAGRLILAAEDNKTNQKVIERQLHLLGYAVQIAGDGQEALLMWQRRRYGLVLTDCHMPNMDGFELTAALRREQDGSGVRTPIIAITANALKGEDQRCLAAGMDDYLSKPVQLVALRDTVARWLPAGQASCPLAEATEAAEPAAAAPAQPLAAAVNPDALKEIVGDDPAVVAEFLSDFVLTAREAVAELQAAYAKRGGHEIGAVAHKLKSSARTVGADALADLCLELEQAGKTEDWTVIDTSMSMLAPCFEAVERFIGTFVGQGGQNEETQLELAMPAA